MNGAVTVIGTPPGGRDLIAMVGLQIGEREGPRGWTTYLRCEGGRVVALLPGRRRELVALEKPARLLMTGARCFVGDVMR